MNSMEQMEARIKEAFADEQYVKELFALEKPEDAQAKLQEKGISMTLDEVKAIPKMLKAAQMNGDELSEDLLEDVAGGVLTVAAATIIAAGIGAGGAIIGAGIERWGW